MFSESLTCVLRYIHQLGETAEERQRSDAELLNRFLAQRDESAFRHLVHRHGRMVLSVCRQVLRQREDAEDAFQAVFLILARNAASIRKRDALASWLYGVAYRTSLKARAEMNKRRQHEKLAAKTRPVQIEREWALRELQAVLAEEVARLAVKYRAPFVLCCLEGMSRAEAARQLGWKEGTVSGRLAEARKLLQARLERRGFALAAVLCASAIDSSTEAAAPLLIRTTIEAALTIAAGQPATAIVSAPVAALVQGITRSLFFSRVKLMGLALAIAGLVTAAAGSRLHHVLANPAESESATFPATLAADKPADKKPDASAKEKDKIVLRGRVLDPEGKPLAGATAFFLPTGDDDDAPKVPAEEVKSGADGRFRFVVKRSHLVHGRWLAAAAKGYGLDWIDADKLGADEITLRLAKDMPITGRILNLEGRPVKDASVEVKEVEAPPEGDLGPVLESIRPLDGGGRLFVHPLRDCSVGKQCRFLPPVKTDEQGRFRFTGLGKERIVRLRVEGPDIEHQVLYLLTRTGVNVKELLKTVPDLRGLMRLPAIYGPTFEHLAGPTRLITGTVRDRATGKPLADVPINGRVSESWWENYVKVITDKEGRYRLIGLPKGRSYHLSVWGLKKDFMQIGKTIGDSEGLTPITLDFELVRGVRVRGRITDKTTGKPVPAALWYVPLEKNKHFAALPGKDNSLFYGTGHRNKEDGSYSVLALPGPGMIYVRAEVKDNPYTVAALDPADRAKAATTNPEEGEGVTFTGVGGLTLGLSGHNAYRIIDPVPDAETLTCDFSFDRGLTRTGSVMDPDGKPLSGVRVNGLSAMGGVKRLAGSSFQALALNPVQPRTLVFLHEKRKLMGHIRLGGNEKEPVTVRLQPGGVLTGRVLDEDGKPLFGAAIHVAYRLSTVNWLLRDTAVGPSVQTDAAGGFRIEGFMRTLAAWQDVVQTDAAGRFRIEGVFADLKFGLKVSKGDDYFSTDEKHQELTLETRTKDVGDIIVKKR